MGRLDSFRVCRWSIAALRREELACLRERATSHRGSHAILETCQRLEVYSFASCDCPSGRSATGFEALAALGEVAAGLDAVVLGEQQVFGQVRKMLLGAPHPISEAGMPALAAAREFRRGLRSAGTSGRLLDAALALAEVEARGRVVVVGTGHMGRLIATRAQELGFDEIVVAGRSAPNGDWLAKSRAKYVPLDRIPEEASFAIAVGCLGPDAALIDPDRQFAQPPGLIVDLGTPRTFADSSPTPLIDIATLERVQAAGEQPERQALRLQFREMLQRRLEMSSEDRHSPVGELRLSVEQVRQREVIRMQRLHPEVPAAMVEAFSRSLINQLFHAPSRRIRKIEDPVLAEQLLELFRDPMPDGAAGSS